MIGHAEAWREYVGALETLSTLEVTAAESRARIEREYHESGSRLQRQQNARAEELRLLTDRVAGTALKVRQFAQSVGASATAAVEQGLVPIDQVQATLERMSAQLRKAEESRDWVARFSQNERSTEEAWRRELERAAEEQRRAAELAANSAAASPAVGAGAAAGGRRATTSTRLVVVIGAIAAVAIIAVVLIMTIVR